MSLTPADVQNLNNAISGVGNVFETQRRDAMQQQNLNIQQELRERMLDAEMRRMTAEEGRQNLLGQGNINATLEGPDGGQVTYGGPASGYQGFINAAAAKGVTLKPVALPRATPFNITLNADDGPIVIHARNVQELQSSVDEIKKSHKIMPPEGPKPPPGTPAMQDDKYATDLENQAGQIEQMINSGPGQFDQGLQDQANAFRSRAQAIRSTVGKQLPPDEITDVFDPITGSHRFTRKTFVEPGTPYQPAGTLGLPDPSAPTESPSPYTDKTGRKFRYKGALSDPSKDRNPANWELANRLSGQPTK